MTFTTFSTCIYHQYTNTFCHIIYKNSINLLNMTTSRYFAKKTQDEKIHTTKKVHYTSIRNDLSLQKRLYSIYCLQSYFRILISGYAASNIMINSRPSSRKRVLCIDLLSLPLLMSYEHPKKIWGSTAGIMRYSTNGHIGAPPWVQNIITAETYLQV